VLLCHGPLSPVIFHALPHSLDLHPFPTRRSSDLRVLLRGFRTSTARLDSSRDSAALPSRCWSTRTSWWPSIRPCHSSRRPSSVRSEEHTSELQSRVDLVCSLLLEKKKKKSLVYMR